MPEEKKKENFTFSDKIKDSKKAVSKSFANRVSSKIGRDGKPRQTIFERTKRDAPFLIAALVALLLLPFLYKYSGSVNEEAMITPSSSETVFDPERYAFAPDVENPEGQIAQLSGRDSLSLIKGWGSDESSYAANDEYDYDYDARAQRDAYADSSAASAKKAKSDTNIDIEENTTNIYKKRARTGTRAAFKRAATKINGLTRGAGARPGGKPLGVGNWGGSLKGAAKRVKDDKPRNSPKPVSLQPLQAAGKPSRSAFGNTAAGMRQVGDALGKHDAKQAILDAQVKPVEPGSFGGMTTGDGSFHGGGSGNLERKFNYQGKEPWWWDLMKTRSQALWQHEMDRKWDWEKWMDKLAQNILGGLLNCLITGNSDGDVDHFLGAKAGTGSSPKCCGLNEAQFQIQYASAYASVAAGENRFEKACEGIRKGDKGKKDCPSGWDPGTKVDADLNFFQVRGNCLGLALGGKYGKGEPSLNLGYSCKQLNTNRHYALHPTGKAMKWDRYHWVVVRNYVPIEYEDNVRVKDASSKVQRAAKNRMQLCSVYDNNLRMDKETSAGLSAMYNLSAEDRAHLEKMERVIEATEKQAKTDPDEFDYEPYPSSHPKTAKELRKEMEAYARAHAHSIYKDNDNGWYATEKYDAESLDDACVVYVAHGDILDWEKGFKPQMISLLTKMVKDRKLAKGDRAVQMAEKMFRQLDLMFVEGMASDKTLSHRKHEMKNLPMPYWQFYESYVVRYGTTGKENDTGSRASVSDRKFRLFGDNTVMGARCYFDNSVHIDCEHNQDDITATVTFNGESYKGGYRPGVYYENGIRAEEDPTFIEEKKNIEVIARFIPLSMPENVDPLEQRFHGPKEASKEAPNELVYTFAKDRIMLGNGSAVPEIKGKVVWQLFRGGNPEAISTATCDVGTAGDYPTPTVDEKECPNAQVSEHCCKKLTQGRWKWDGSRREGDRCYTWQRPDVEIVPPPAMRLREDEEIAIRIPCTDARIHDSEECCHEKHPDWTWEEGVGCHERPKEYQRPDVEIVPPPATRLTDDVEIVRQIPCTDARIHDSEECCHEKHPDWTWDENRGCYKPQEYQRPDISIVPPAKLNGRDVELGQIPCTDARIHDSEECCHEKHPDWTWSESRGCYKPQEYQSPDITLNGPDPVRFDRDVEIRNRENTRFAPFLAWIPQDPEGREPMLNQEKDKFAPGKFLKKAGEGDANYCAETTPLVMDSNAAAEFVREVAKQYNATGPEVLIDPTFTYGGGRFPTDGEFVDALKIAKQLGMKEVSAAATCELGRDIVRLSRDPHTKGMKVKGNYRSPYAESEEKLGGDKTDRDFHNDLGAFIMYIGQNSLLYPAKHLIENGECDQRFIPETAAGVAGCTATPGMPGQFHFNNYASYTPVANGIYEAAYKPSIEAMGLGKITVNPPLQVLSAGKIGTEQYGYKDCGKISCASRSAKYREEIRLLLNEKEDFTAWEGNACEEFEGTSATIPIEQVLEYVQMVCENGLHLKPHGVGSAKVGVGGNKPVAKSNRDGKTPTVTLDNNKK